MHRATKMHNIEWSTSVFDVICMGFKRFLLFIEGSSLFLVAIYMGFKVWHCRNVVVHMGFKVCHCKNVVFYMGFKVCHWLLQQQQRGVMW